MYLFAQSNMKEKTKTKKKNTVVSYLNFHFIAAHIIIIYKRRKIQANTKNKKLLGHVIFFSHIYVYNI